MKNFLFVLLLLCVAAWAQQPQANDIANTEPVFRINAKLTNGVAPGYWPTAGSGLTLNLSAGTAFCSGAIQSYVGGTLTMTASATNQVYLNTAASCAPAVKTSGWSVSDIPIASVVAGSSSITSITDVRTMFNPGSGSGGGLGDPGSNGIIKRTALNTTAAAASADVIGLWTGTCNATTFMRGDGSCQTGNSNAVQIQGKNVDSGVGSATAGQVVGVVSTDGSKIVAQDKLRCEVRDMPGGPDLGAQLNACESKLGASKGTILISGGGNSSTQWRVTHNLQIEQGNYTWSQTLGSAGFFPNIVVDPGVTVNCNNATLNEPTNSNIYPIIITAPLAGWPTPTTYSNANLISHDNQVIGCKFVGSTGIVNAFTGDVALSDCAHCKVLNNTFTNTTSIGVTVGSGASAYTGTFARDFEVAGNSFEGVGQPIAVINGDSVHIHGNYDHLPRNVAGALIDVEPNVGTDYATNIEIDNNIGDYHDASSTSRYGVTMQTGSTTHTGPTKIHDNIFKGSATLPNLIDGIALGSHQQEAYNNFISYSAQSAITAVASDGESIKNNYILCSGGTGDAAISLNGTVTNYNVESNIIVTDTTCPSVSLHLAIREIGSGDDFNIFKGNIFRDFNGLGESGIISTYGPHSVIIDQTKTSGTPNGAVNYFTPPGLPVGLPGGTQSTELVAPVPILSGVSTDFGGTCSGSATRYWVVSAVDSNGGEGPLSGEINNGSYAGLCPRLKWDWVIGANKYRIYQGSTAGGPYQLIATTSSGVNFYMTLGNESFGAPPSAYVPAVSLSAARLLSTNVGTVPSAVDSFTSWPTTAGRNDISYALGFQFKVSSVITVTKLGRLYVAGNTNNHVVKLWSSANQTTPLATATILSSSTSDGNSFKWVALSQPVTLAPGVTYACAIDETASGDTWKDSWTPSLQSLFTNVIAAYNASNGFYPNTTQSSGNMYDTCSLEWYPGIVSIARDSNATHQLGAAPGKKGLVVSGNIGQTANLQEWQDNAGNVKSSVEPGGLFDPPIANLANLTACSSSTEGAHAVAINCNAACSAGGTCTAGGTTHCELYCNGTSYVETGR